MPYHSVNILVRLPSGPLGIQKRSLLSGAPGRDAKHTTAPRNIRLSSRLNLHLQSFQMLPRRCSGRQRAKGTGTATLDATPTPTATDSTWYNPYGTTRSARPRVWIRSNTNPSFRSPRKALDVQQRPPGPNPAPLSPSTLHRTSEGGRRRAQAGADHTLDISISSTRKQRENSPFTKVFLANFLANKR